VFGGYVFILKKQELPVEAKTVDPDEPVFGAPDVKIVPVLFMTL
jgi:hypothetical protein